MGNFLNTGREATDAVGPQETTNVQYSVIDIHSFTQKAFIGVYYEPILCAWEVMVNKTGQIITFIGLISCWKETKIEMS